MSDTVWKQRVHVVGMEKVDEADFEFTLIQVRMRAGCDVLCIVQSWSRCMLLLLCVYVCIHLSVCVHLCVSVPCVLIEPWHVAVRL